MYRTNVMTIKNILYPFFLAFSLLFVFQGAYAQNEDVEIVDYETVKSYEIGGVKVTGLKYRDSEAIIARSGLRVGKKIKIPGQDIPNAINALLSLQLFSNIEIYLEKTVGDIAFLEIKLQERPTLSRYSYTGVKKMKHDDLNEVLENVVLKGGIVTEDTKQLARKKLLDYYYEKGFQDAKVRVLEKRDTSKTNSVQLEFAIDKKKRVRVGKIAFSGNENAKGWKLKRKMENTKGRWNILKKSKYIAEDFRKDKNSIIAFYNNIGYRDAKIVRDSVWRDEKGRQQIAIEIDEGAKYFYRDISWKGNSIYDDDYLARILGIQSGDVYNKELLDKRLSFSLDGRDVSSLYMDDGYLMFRVEPVERAIEGDSIDIEVRITEGPQVTIDKVIIKGNDRTHEDVIRREIRTRPGKKFSRSDIIRSQRQILNLGYFNPEAFNMETPVNPARGTVDIIYTLEEKPSDQLELSAGYGGVSGLIGTLGVTFNNFSLNNITDRSTWNPLPQGDAQKLSVRAQSNSQFFQSYNISFTEPWLGGKKPTSLTTGLVYSAFDYSAFGSGRLAIARGFIGLGTQLKWPDDFFSLYGTLNIEQISLDDFRNNGFSIENGTFNNNSLKLALTRSSINEPIYPRSGMKMSLSVQFTPYYFWRDLDSSLLSDDEIAAAVTQENKVRGGGDPMSQLEEAAFVDELQNSSKFKFLEYHKWRLDSEWYFNLVDKLVLMTQAKIGFMGYYREEIGLVPFERAAVGGSGLNNQTQGINGRDIISLRGYEVEDIEVNNTNIDGASIWNKFTVELRYPLSTNPNSTIYFHTFAQAANAWDNFRDYNPFELKRSAGVGLRVFLPMFGLMGFDYGFGFDKQLGDTATFRDYGQFNIVLGFEPE